MNSKSSGGIGTVKSPRLGRSLPGSRALRHRFGAAIAALLAVGLLGLVPPAQADDLGDQASALEQQAHDVQASLEFVDSGIAKSAADLVMFQGQLPGAQAALTQAQSRVSAATAEVNSLAARMDLAQQNKDKITAQIATDAKKATETKALIGQIAAQSYKAGGLPANLTLILGAESTTDLANSIDLAEQALRSQTAALEELTAQKATNQNAQARLVAVEAEITDLKSQADAALIAEQSARDAAATQKATVDKLITDSASLNAKLEAQKPQIQAKLKEVQGKKAAVAAEIAEIQRKEREAAAAAAKAEAERIARAQAAAAAAAAGNNNGGGGGGGNSFVPPPYVPPAPGNPSAFGLQHPFSVNVPITSGFGWRQTPAGTIDFNGTGGYVHTGIDFGATCGTPVYAAAAGTVVMAGWDVWGGGWGVKISHGVIQGNALLTAYYHNTNVQVSNGQKVSRGQLIAISGGTGNSTGCHAHFETWLNGVAVDPMTLL
ncbi:MULTISPECIES: M23 family metallopeptidase [Arthrobacter]|uniref:Peptidase M23 n=1 Tax=Arthrobacter psychrochitiniphilus TaxID=291045 RepID=A0A2V3DQD4_9MICC|nr:MULTISPECIES: M23 family metallopeptidase [Arthrobacter]NYG18303.1 murein DD-endopeptidase MepM/ murein hydrolase activator NlpD [Arthrobacter psychrochitiniphilus]PXA64911.1 peptidase M23 [Arthrobacter psychrochitiniphilus]